MKQSGCDVPDWMLALKNPTKAQKKKRKQKPVERNQIRTTSQYDERKQKRKREMVEASQRRKQRID
jgi:ATP-dependent RNA helicase DDX52/ROK1